MNNTQESYFGPPSQLIDVAQFIQSTLSVPAISDADAWLQLSEDQKNAVEIECNMSNAKNALEDIWKDPELSGYLSRTHAATICSIHDSADKSNKRKRKRPKYLDPSKQSQKLAALEKDLDSIQLCSWPLMLHSALFLRTPKNSDHNALTKIKTSQNTTPVLSASSHEALITVTVYTPLAWSPSSPCRSSQHTVLSSQTLGNLLDAIPCPSNELRKEIVLGEGVIGYEDTRVRCRSVLCIEGIAYGDGQEGDYAEKLLSQIELIPSDKRPVIRKSSTPLHETLFSSLSLRLNEPYWLLHQGNCEHFIVVDQIRLQNLSDPASGYPLTLQLTPTLLSLCRACSKVPAVYTIVGDIRLGESPCLMCSVCWRIMGEPEKDQGVIVVPLAEHKFGVA